jgi:hypothetical protein
MNVVLLHVKNHGKVIIIIIIIIIIGYLRKERADIVVLKMVQSVCP